MIISYILNSSKEVVHTGCRLACIVIDKSWDASDREYIDEWDWRSMSENE